MEETKMEDKDLTIKELIKTVEDKGFIINGEGDGKIILKSQVAAYKGYTINPEIKETFGIRWL